MRLCADVGFKLDAAELNGHELPLVFPVVESEIDPSLLVAFVFDENYLVGFVEVTSDLLLGHIVKASFIYLLNYYYYD